MSIIRSPENKILHGYTDKIHIFIGKEKHGMSAAALCMTEILSGPVASSRAADILSCARRADEDRLYHEVSS
jgi:hypothetical protein